MIVDRASAREVTPEDIQELIDRRQPELNELEYKREPTADVIKAVCAIANFGGGYVLVGVDEDKQHRASGLVTVANLQGECDSIRQAVRDGITPRPFFEVVPLDCNGFDIIVIRVAPQSRPHMISVNKKTGFYSRYDATSETMRYDEIERMFREKIVSVIPGPGSQTAFVESLGGRIGITEGAKGALNRYVDEATKSPQPSLHIISVADEIGNALSEADALDTFDQPTYTRKSGWIVFHPGFPTESRGGIWQQQYGEFSRTVINPSGDLLFEKPIDSVLCWTQAESEFVQSPRLYPNALAEYCLSFCYGLADIAAVTRAKQFIVRLLFANAERVFLPLGEGGSVRFESPLEPPSVLSDATTTSVAIPTTADGHGPFRPRRLAFTVLSQIYSMFGYREKDVPFASQGQVVFNSDSEPAKIAVIQSYLQWAFSSRVESSSEDFDRDAIWFVFKTRPRPLRIAVTKQLIDDFGSDEDAAFKLLDKIGVREHLFSGEPNRPFLISSFGLKPI